MRHAFQSEKEWTPLPLPTLTAVPQVSHVEHPPWLHDSEDTGGAAGVLSHLVARRHQGACV